MELLFQRGASGLLPACEEAQEWLKRKKFGATILVEPRGMRNGSFHRKWFALVQLAYDYWKDDVQTVMHKGVNVLPDFDRFRRDVTILAGFHRAVVNIKGDVRLEAESLKWASMTEERFSELYDATIRVLLERVFNGTVCPTWTESELRRVADEVMSFAA